MINDPLHILDTLWRRGQILVSGFGDEDIICTYICVDKLVN